MKILIPVFGFAPTGGGRVLSELANNWIDLGHAVTFIAFEDSIEPYFPTVAEILWIDNFGRLVQFKGSKKKEFPFQYFLKRYSLVKAINSYGKEFDIVLASHSFTAFSVYYSNISAMKFYYIQAYEPEYYSLGKLTHIPYKLVSKASYKYNLLRIVNSEIYLKYNEINAEMVVYPGINLRIFTPKKEIFLNNAETFKIGCIGRIQKFKGTHLVINAFEILRESYKNVELYLAFGNKELLSIPGLKLVNPANDSELAEFYREVDVIVAPGTIQLGAMHYPVLEAMACGTPVISTGYSGANNENSFIVKVNDVVSIVQCLEEILLNPQLAKLKANKALDHVKKFSWDIVSHKMIQYFNMHL